MRFSRLKSLDPIKADWFSGPSSSVSTNRPPVGVLLNDIQNVWDLMKSGPNGIDNISDLGFELVVTAIRDNAAEIFSGPPDPNVLWSILAEYADKFTFITYKQLGEIAHNYLYS